MNEEIRNKQEDNTVLSPIKTVVTETIETNEQATDNVVLEPYKKILQLTKKGFVIGIWLLIFCFLFFRSLVNGIIVCLVVTLLATMLGINSARMDKTLDKKAKIISFSLIVIMVAGLIASISYNVSTSNNNASSSKTITSNQGNETNRSAFDMATYCVRQKLKSPSTADFPAYSDDYISHSDDEYTVSAYVDAQNSFGATVRTYFIVRMTRSGYNWYDWTNVTVDFIE